MLQYPSVVPSYIRIREPVCVQQYSFVVPFSEIVSVSQMVSCIIPLLFPPSKFLVFMSQCVNCGIFFPSPKFLVFASFLVNHSIPWLFPSPKFLVFAIQLVSYGTPLLFFCSFLRVLFIKLFQSFSFSSLRLCSLFFSTMVYFLGTTLSIRLFLS
jgi:hypothetical protein